MNINCHKNCINKIVLILFTLIIFNQGGYGMKLRPSKTKYGKESVDVCGLTLNSTITMEEAENTAKRIKNDSKLIPVKKLAFERLTFQPGALSTILNAVLNSSTSTLEEIYISECNFNDENIRTLADILKNASELDHLKLNDNGIGDKEIAILAPALIDNRTLRKFSFSGNPLGKAGIQTVANILEKNRTLPVICFDIDKALKDSEYGNLNHSDAKTLLTAMLYNTTIKSVVVSWHYDDRDALELIQFRNKNLKKISEEVKKYAPRLVSENNYDNLLRHILPKSETELTEEFNDEVAHDMNTIKIDHKNITLYINEVSKLDNAENTDRNANANTSSLASNFTNKNDLSPETLENNTLPISQPSASDVSDDSITSISLSGNSSEDELDLPSGKKIRLDLEKDEQENLIVDGTSQETAKFFR